jgi:hypothetical protein
MLPISELPAVSLTCKSLGWIAQTFIFTRISFFPPTGKQFLTQYKKRLPDRVLFLATSSHTVNSVAEFSLTMGKGPSCCTVNSDLVLDAVFDVMPLFSESPSHQLMLSQVHSAEFKSLCPSRLELKFCIIRGDDLPPIAVKSFICNDDYRRKISLDFWIRPKFSVSL